jgi:oxygen-dependent protoporphyrinogen oxidase
MSPQPSPPRIAVVGGGISGLAAAHRIVELAPACDLTLFEASDRVGGVLETVHRDSFLIERSADMFTTKDPWALNLCRRIGIEDQLINTNKQNRRAFVVHRGRLERVPEGFTLMSPARIWPVVKTRLLSWRGKVRLACERFIRPRKDDSDESLESFAIRRLGREVYENLVQPLIGGIYTADPTRLSMQAAMPEFVEMEREYGNLTRGVQEKAAKQHRAGTGARYGMFLAPRNGITTLVDAIEARLPAGSVQLNAAVSRIEHDDQQWKIVLAGHDEPLRFDAVIVTTPAHHAAGLLLQNQPELAQELAGIPYASAAVPVFAFRRDQVEHSLNGFGFVTPFVEKRQVLSVSFGSIKFPGRAPDDSVLFRVFIGGACQAELAELPEQELFDIAQQELRDLLGVRGEPQFRELVRWRKAMPQYHVGHLDRVSRIEALVAQLPGLALAGNAYRGVGIPFCIHSGETAAESLVADQKVSGRH